MEGLSCGKDSVTGGSNKLMVLPHLGMLLSVEVVLYHLWQWEYCFLLFGLAFFVRKAQKKSFYTCSAFLMEISCKKTTYTFRIAKIILNIPHPESFDQLKASQSHFNVNFIYLW